MPRDSLADSSRTMINHGRRETRRPRNKRNHIGPIDPHALKIPARRAESLFGEIHPHLYAEPKQYCWRKGNGKEAKLSYSGHGLWRIATDWLPMWKCCRPTVPPSEMRLWS